MSNLEKYRNAFVEGLDVEEDKITDSLEYEGIPEWDSVGHMSLVACIEEAFDIMMETEDTVSYTHLTLPTT